MKRLALLFLLVGCLLWAFNSAEAGGVSLSVKATITAGTNLGTPVILKCLGYKFSDNPNADPWDPNNCPAQVTSLDFGTLTTRLYKSDGSDGGGAGCFYAKEFFIVYLYPDAWGGKGYDITSTGSFTDADFQKAVVFTPVYSKDDKYDPNGDPQGDLTSDEKSWNPDINKDKLAQGGPYRILKAKRARIVRAQYGIPPKPGAGQTRPTGWQEIPLTKTAGTYTGTITITLTEWQ